MLTRLVFFAAAVVAAGLSCDGARSGSAFVELRPGESSFWHTATNATLELPVEFPPHASSATLSVSGVKYSWTTNFTAASLAGGGCVVVLPTADSPKSENVYDFVLTFDNGVVRRAKLGLLDGAYGTTRGSTRCLFDADGRAWAKVVKMAVVPVPYGTTSLSVNGAMVDAGLGGEQGWYALGPVKNREYGLTMEDADGGESSAALIGVDGGFSVIFQ